MDKNSLMPVRAPVTELEVRTLTACNDFTVRYGLTLSPDKIMALEEARESALRRNGRVEFGEGILKKLIYTFCDSPYMSQYNYAQTMVELQDMFYYLKSESGDRLSDDELLGRMRAAFDGPAGGSVEFLAFACLGGKGKDGNKNGK